MRDKPLKILLANDTYHPDVNGSSYFTQRLARYLKDRGHDVAVAAPSRTFKNERRVANGIDVFGFRSAPIVMYKGFRFALPFCPLRQADKIFNYLHPNIVHIQGHFTVSAAIAKTARKYGVPIVGTNHFMPENLTHYLRLPEALEKIIRKIAWAHFRGIFDKLDVVTTPTETAAELMRKNGFAKKIFAISCGIDLKKFNPSKADERIRTKYGLPADPLCLYVGRLDKEKNIDMILHAISMMPKNIALHFAVVGKGAVKKELERLVVSLGLGDRVTFLGFVADEDLPGLYAIAHCFIIAGTAELQSIVTMEAMASGLPVIAVNAVALPELVRHERNGYLFNMGDTASLAGYMEKIFSDRALRDRLSADSLGSIQRHDIERTIDKFEEIYANLEIERVKQ